MKERLDMQYHCYRGQLWNGGAVERLQGLNRGLRATRILSYKYTFNAMGSQDQAH